MKSENLKLNRVIQVKVTESEYRAMKADAEQRQVTLSAAARSVLCRYIDRESVVLHLSYDVAVALGFTNALVDEDGVLVKIPSKTGECVQVDQLVGRVYVSVDGKDAYEDALFYVDGILDMEAVSRLKAEISKYAEAK